ncbi:Deoxyuridine 5'-triphosphate nucleotidohydrolase [Venustampulla echinocandica]|uniref:Deoxyuridine 5'-triphosphate nucleotidohydrolase n=1 Tax=Venustampulla echinocandica TaxID=2656787 RepID=A0A370TSZ6_9HELO|nr:Deoxyuridine 5'-triphosphate nucleotidohydrolase [Venustampulla echinocandica]RDL38618.1 Deoxyuridine 5'-triphosphate nucleotidohydrolase [Venustampulla echinocandica]
MILPGRSLITRQIIAGTISPTVQSQPCGVDLTLKKVLTWVSPGSIDFDNSLRRTAMTKEIIFQIPTKNAPSQSILHHSIHLALGSYLVEFSERVSVPLDTMGQLFVRSSLFRSGALLSAGVMDSGYEGAVGALLQVVNPSGLQLYKNARLAQFVFHQMSEPVKGYDGAYQGSPSILGTGSNN